MSGGKQVETAQEIAGELENIRVAWQWAVDQSQVQALQEMADILYLFYQFHNLYSEAVTAFEKAAYSLRGIRSTSAQIVLAEILCLLSWMYIRLGRLQDASQTAATSEQLYRQLGIVHPLSSLATDPKIPLATCALIRGDYLQARELADAAQISSRLHQHRGNLMVSFYILASIGLALGDYDDAQKCADEGYALAQADANEWFAAYCLITKGDVARALGNDDQAAHYYQASFALREKFQDREGMGLACSRLGTIALQRGAYTDAIHCFQSGLAFYQNLGDPGGLAGVLSGLGEATFRMGDKHMAARYFRQALDAAAQAGTLSLILSILAATAEMLIQGEYPEDGAEILAFVLHHAGCPQEVKSRIERDLSAYGSLLRAEDIHEAGTFQGSSLESVISFLDDKLALAEQLRHSQTASHHPLREPLTARELQVLHLLARGLSNREMAQELVLAVGTVKTHVHRISSKLDARSRTEAVAHARELHLF
jgi:ATP/maltotriose-dependent transcriptional regulator MalT